MPFTDAEKKQWNIRVTFQPHVTFMSIDDGTGKAADRGGTAGFAAFCGSLRSKL
jgi:hypothetical protein